MNHAVKEKVVEVQKASRIVGDVHKSVVDVEKLPEVIWKEDPQPADDPKEEAPGILTFLETAI